MLSLLILYSLSSLATVVTIRKLPAVAPLVEAGVKLYACDACMSVWASIGVAIFSCCASALGVDLIEGYRGWFEIAVLFGLSGPSAGLTYILLTWLSSLTPPPPTLPAT